MRTRFESLVEKPLRLLLARELLDARMPIPPSRFFDGTAPHDQPKPAAAQPPAVRHILAPTDFSPASTRALQFATQLAGSLRARLTALHVNLPVPCNESAGDQACETCKRQAELRDKAILELERQLQEAGKVHGAEAEAVVCEGYPHVVIVGEALSRSADLIVIAKHGHSDERNLLLGKTAEHVVRNARCPVLLVGDGEFEFPHRMEGSQP